MNKIGSYETELLNISPKKWEEFLKQHSALPGEKANLELAKAFARVGTLMDFKKYIRLGPEKAQENTPEEFLAMCGILGLAQYLAKYHDDGLLQQFREKANDPRRRIRDSVALGLEIIGKKKRNRLIRYAKLWVDGSAFEQRAVIVALCEFDLKADHEMCLEVLDLLDYATATIVERDEMQDQGYKELEKALSYCWSMAVVGLPVKGKNKMERWLKTDHPIVNRIMRSNLKKKRLQKIDEKWIQYWTQQI